LDGILETAKKEGAMRHAFFNIVSGQETYKKTWRETGKFNLLFRISFRTFINKYFKKKKLA